MVGCADIRDEALAAALVPRSYEGAAGLGAAEHDTARQGSELNDS